MDLSQNIAYYRKLCGYTQEQLANHLGVTAQSVSKWENNISSPDISILPDLAKVLGVDINSFFAETPHSANGIKFTELPNLCHDSILSLYVKARHTFYCGEKHPLSQEAFHKQIDQLRKELDYPLSRCGYMIDEGSEHGAVFISGPFSMVDRSYGGTDSTWLFHLDKAGELLSVLGDPNARKVLKLFYEKQITEGEGGTFLTPQAVADATGLTEDGVNAAATKLRHVRLLDEVEKIQQNGYHKEYTLLYGTDLVSVLAILRMAYIHTSSPIIDTLMYRDVNNHQNYTFPEQHTPDPIIDTLIYRDVSNHQNYTVPER